MSNMLTNALLTVIALLLAAIAVKLYFPFAQEYGPRSLRGRSAKADDGGRLWRRRVVSADDERCDGP